nr:unnamed protein product [Callosobruchus analis]
MPEVVEEDEEDEEETDNTDDSQVVSKRNSISMTPLSTISEVSVVDRNQQMPNFLAILVLSGSHQLPQKRMYWCKVEDLGIDVVSMAMPRNKYDQIKQNIHFKDN